MNGKELEILKPYLCHIQKYVDSDKMSNSPDATVDLGFIEPAKYFSTCSLHLDQSNQEALAVWATLLMDALEICLKGPEEYDCLLQE